MPQIPGLSDIDIQVRRSARSRRFSLRLSSVDGKVTLTMPPRAPLAEAYAFARANEGWLRNALARQPVRHIIGPGSALPVEGRMLTICHGPRRGVQVQGDSILVGGDPATIGPRLAAWAKAQARDRLAKASDFHAGRIGRKVARITLRDTRSRWGSCSADGALMYSWRLILAPPAVLDYVAAHEVAHLDQMNHSAAFWAIVTRLCPDWQTHRDWLRQHGSALHAVDFGTSGD